MLQVTVRAATAAAIHILLIFIMVKSLVSTPVPPAFAFSAAKRLAAVVTSLAEAIALATVITTKGT